MISVEQVHALEERVEKAIAYISSLKSENAGLRRDLESWHSEALARAAELESLRAEAEEARARLASMEGAQDEAKAAQARIAELEAAAESYRRDQAGIEAGIVHALQKLDAFEDLVLKVESANLGASAPEKTRESPPATPSPAKAPASPAPQAAAAPAPEPKVATATTVPETKVPASPAPEAPAPAPAKRNADELSMEELEAATAPEPLEGELDIF